MPSPVEARTPAPPRRAAVAGRLRALALIPAGLAILYGALDLAAGGRSAVPAAGVCAGLVVTALAARALARRAPGRGHAVPLAVLAVILWTALFSVHATLSPAGRPAAATPAILLLAAAALVLPWGARAQATAALGAILGCGVVIASAGRPLDPALAYAAAALLVATAASCAGAAATARAAAGLERRVRRLRRTSRTMRAKAVEKADLLAGVSHELRTPLNVVLGYVDLLLDRSAGSPLAPAQREILGRIGRNAATLSHLVNDLADLSRIQAGRLRVAMAPVEVAPLFAELSTLMDLLLAGRDVGFTARIEPACERVEADPDRLRQVVSNLLVNAVKFTERGLITLAAEPDGAGGVVISVAETGIGTAPAAPRPSGEPLRGGQAPGDRARGAGVGLSISSRLASLMGATVTVESEPGRGSRFALGLRAAPAAGGVPASAPAG
jgi:two-component system cell cycle sensor histidine kinase PleC